MNPSLFFGKAADGPNPSLARGQHILIRNFSKKPDIIAGQPIQSQTTDLRVPESLTSVILFLPDVPFSPEAHSIPAVVIPSRCCSSEPSNKSPPPAAISQVAFPNFSSHNPPLCPWRLHEPWTVGSNANQSNLSLCPFR